MTEEGRGNGRADGSREMGSVSVSRGEVMESLGLFALLAAAVGALIGLGFLVVRALA